MPSYKIGAHLTKYRKSDGGNEGGLPNRNLSTISRYLAVS